MYIPKLYREEDRNAILQFIRRNEFAILVTHDGGKPIASHLLMETAGDGERLLLNGHMSKANPQWKMFDLSDEVLVIFQGPNAYISPTWYNHLNVPTWNYQAIHAYGKARIVEDSGEAYSLLKSLVDRHESGDRYRMELLPSDFVEKEIRGVVAFQIEVTRTEANYKLSQNRSTEDYANIIARLDERGDDLSHGVAEAMRRQRPR